MLKSSSSMVAAKSTSVDASEDIHEANNLTMNSNLAPRDGNDMKSPGCSAEPAGSSLSPSCTPSTVQRTREQLKQSEAFSSDDTTSQHSEVTCKQSNTWPSIGNKEENSSEVSLRPQSSRLVDGIGDNQLSVKKSKRNKSDKSKVRRKNLPSKRSQGASQGDEASSEDHDGTWRPLINSETKMSSKDTARMIEKGKNTSGEMMESVQEIASSGDKEKEKQRGDNDYEDGSSKDQIQQDIATPKPIRHSRCNTLQRSLSLSSLGIKSTLTPTSSTRRGDRGKDRYGASPRGSGGPFSKKDLLSFSEHHAKDSTVSSRKISSFQHSPRNQGARAVPDADQTTSVPKSDEITSLRRTTRSSARNRVSQSEHDTLSKPKPSRRRRHLPDEQAPVGQHTKIDERRDKTRTEGGKAGPRRRLRSKDSLGQCENITSRPQQAGRGSTLASSWGDLELEGESDSEDKSLTRKKEWKAQCSWDLSQLIVMEELLSAQPEKEGSRKDKVKEALYALTKKIIGSRNNDVRETNNPLVAMEDSCQNNVFLLNDSYQQNFGSTNIDFGMFGSSTNSRSTDTLIPDGHAEHGIDVGNEKEIEVNGNQDRTTHHTTTERQNSSQNVETSDAEGQGSLLERSKTMEEIAHPEKPRNLGPSLSGRMGRNEGKMDNNEKKPSSSRQGLSKKLSPGQVLSSSSQQRRRATSLSRKLLPPRRVTEQRPRSCDDDLVSPRSIATVVVPSSITTSALGSGDSGKGSATTARGNTTHRTSAARRRFSAGGTLTSTTHQGTTRELDLLQW